MIGSPGSDQAGSSGHINLPTVTISPVEGQMATILQSEAVVDHAQYESPAVPRYQRYVDRFNDNHEQDAQDAEAAEVTTPSFGRLFSRNGAELQQIATSAPDFRRVHSAHQSLPAFPASSTRTHTFFGPLSPETPLIRQNNEAPLVPEMRSVEQLKKVATNLYCRGFLDGLYSDIAIHVLGATFNLHKICIAPKRLLCIDVARNITAEGLAVVFARIYGQPEVRLTPNNVCGVLAASSFFNDKELGDVCAEFIIATLETRNVADYMIFADERYYGSRSEAIVDASFSFLCQHGFYTQSQDAESKFLAQTSRALKDALVRLPIHLVERILSSDCFFAPTEFDRFCLIRDVIVHLQLCRRTTKKEIQCKKFQHGWKENNCTEFDAFSARSRVRISKEGKDHTLTLRATRQISNERTNHVEDASRDEGFYYDEDYDSFEDMDAFPDFEGNKHESSACSSNRITTSKCGTKSLTSISKQLQEEEKAYKRMLSHSTIYSHMRFDQLLTVRDLDIISERILQRAFWSQQELRMLMESSGELNSELGIRNSATGVPTDDTDKIDEKRLRDMLKGPMYLHRSVRFPPYRFGVEFSDLKRLHGGGRCYSSSMQYAG
ncbi:hypothetical protein BJ742DRAFT_884975 [Cladochytrium replicatum]|nr:hypothetical protein BJ742DRAFT_884975 [Cladochytrium replicatum]